MDIYHILSSEMESLKESKTYCVLRKDLEDQELNICTSMGYTKIDWTVPHKVHQPDRLDEGEYNMFVWIPNNMTNTSGMIVVVHSIDFDFMYDDRGD